MGLVIGGVWVAAPARAEDQLEAVTDVPPALEAPPIVEERPPINATQRSRVLRGLRAHLRAARRAHDAERVAQLEYTLRRVQTGDISEEEFAFVAQEVAVRPEYPAVSSDPEQVPPDRTPLAAQPVDANPGLDSLRMVLELAREKDPDLAMALEREMGRIRAPEEPLPPVPTFEDEAMGARQIRPIDLALAGLSPELREQLDAFLDREGLREAFEEGALLPPPPASYDE